MTHDDAAVTTPSTSPAPSSRPVRVGVLGSVWNAVSGAIGIVMGLIPHLLHHVGLLAGAALVTGTGGNLLFGGLGLLFSVPLLRRLYRRFGSWKAPAIALVVFAVMFSLSAFVIGPAITDGPAADAPAQTPYPSPTQTPTDHTSHHG